MDQFWKPIKAFKRRSNAFKKVKVIVIATIVMLAMVTVRVMTVARRKRWF